MSDVVSITELNPIWAKISDPTVVDNYLRYTKEWYQQGQYRKMRREARIKLVGKDGVFLAGFIPRVKDYLEKRNYSVLMEYSTLPFPSKGIASLKGISYRDDQRKALEEIIGAGRGVFQAPTGSGKTLLIAGVVASYNTNTIVIVHTNSLFKQTIEELSRWNSKVGMLGAGEEKIEKVTVAMRQTLARGIESGKFANGFFERWGVVIADEAHHVSSLSGDYALILSRILARIRFGFTATVPVEEEGKMALEGLIGPPIGKTTYQELNREDVLAKPKIKFYRVPENPRYKDVRGTYQQVYQDVVVRNRRRNLLIVDKSLEQIGLGRTVLIMVERLEHGEQLLELLEIKVPGSFVFLHGDTSDQLREEEKRAFSDKKRRGVIATRVWSEGVNIRTVDVVVNAVGGESEIAAIQRFGRGMRSTDTKKEVLLIDFIDNNHRWMAAHSMKRICYYSEMEWM